MNWLKFTDNTMNDVGFIRQICDSILPRFKCLPLACSQRGLMVIDDYYNDSMSYKLLSDYSALLCTTTTWLLSTKIGGLMLTYMVVSDRRLFSVSIIDKKFVWLAKLPFICWSPSWTQYCVASVTYNFKQCISRENWRSRKGGPRGVEKIGICCVITLSVTLRVVQLIKFSFSEKVTKMCAICFLVLTFT